MLTRPQVRMSRLKQLAVVLCLCAILAGLLPRQASAWATTGTSGRIGSIRDLTIYVGDLYMPAGYTAFTLYGATGPLVSRSPGSAGIQNVNARYIVQRWNGASWVNLAMSPVFRGQISASQTYYRFPKPYIQPLETRGLFRLTWVMNWQTTTGAVLGSTYVTANLQTDHVCVTQSRFCRSYAGYFEHR